MFRLLSGQDERPANFCYPGQCAPAASGLIFGTQMNRAVQAEKLDDKRARSPREQMAASLAPKLEITTTGTDTNANAALAAGLPRIPVCQGAFEAPGLIHDPPAFGVDLEL